MCRHYLNLWSQPLSFSLRSIRTTLFFWFLYSPDVSMGWLASINLHIRFFGILLFFIPLLGTSEPAVKKKKKKTGLEEHYLNPKGHIDQIFLWSALSTTFVFGEYSFNYPWPHIVQRNASNQLRKLHKWSFYYVVHILLCVAKAWKQGKKCCMFPSLKYLKMCLYSLKLKFIILWISCEHLNSRWGPGNSGHTRTYLLSLQNAADIISWGRQKA